MQRIGCKWWIRELLQYLTRKGCGPVAVCFLFETSASFAGRENGKGQRREAGRTHQDSRGMRSAAGENHTGEGSGNRRGYGGLESQTGRGEAGEIFLLYAPFEKKHVDNVIS